MRTGLPRPLHGWRAFFGEVGIIVLGVLIALSASQLVDWWQWRQQIKQTDVRFQSELGLSISNAYEHLAIEKCLNDRLAQIGAKLVDSGPTWLAMPESIDHRGLPWKVEREVIPLPFHGRPAVLQPAVTEGWNNALADGTINHLSSLKAGALSEAYAAALRLQSAEQEQAREIAKLAPLGTNMPLSPDLRSEMIATIVNLRRIDGDIADHSVDLILAAKQTGLGFDVKSIQTDNAMLLGFERIARGACVVQPKLP